MNPVEVACSRFIPDEINFSKIFNEGKEKGEKKGKWGSWEEESE